MSRRDVYSALFALGSSVTWTVGSSQKGFLYSSERIRDWSEQQDQPAFFQVSMDEEFQQKTGMPYRVRLMSKWVVYWNSGKDPKVAGAVLGDSIMDALQGALKPQFVPGVQFMDRCTLGGLVYHAFIDGRVFRDNGDNDGQGVLMVPISILVP